jgi:hypothetical protein
MVDAVLTCSCRTPRNGLHRLNRRTIAIATPLSKRSMHATIQTFSNPSLSPPSAQPLARVANRCSIACLDPSKELQVFAGDDIASIWVRHVCFRGFCEGGGCTLSEGRSVRLSNSSFQNIFRCGRSSSEVVLRTMLLAIDSRMGCNTRGML